MALTIDDIMSQLSGLFGNSGAQYQGSGVTTYAAPTTQGFQASGGLLPQGTTSTIGNQLGNQTGNGLGMNLGTAGLALNGLSALSSLFQSQNAFNLAKDQFKFQKDVTNTNLNNSIQSYNNTLEDRLRSRGVVEGTSSDSVQSEIDRKRLNR